MIPRYNCPEISNLWSSEAKFQFYLQAELAVLNTLEEEGVVPKSKANLSGAKINPQRIDEIEKITKHDVIAFCTSITEQFTAENSKYFHYGVTSSDIIDTATSLQIKASLELILEQFEKTLKALLSKAQETKDFLCMGRSHGMNAEPMSFGQKLLGHYVELKRRCEELKDFSDNEITGQFSGAVGNYTILSRDIEERALKKIGLKREPISTQVIPRDRWGKLISFGGLTATSIERLCLELRHLHHSDINEVYEGFAPGQKGSSIMPHKKNPISGENMTGLCRTMRSHVQLALENVLLWHERDISHSSAERLMLPDHFGLFFYVLKRLESTMANLVINRERMEEKVFSQDTYLSSYFLHFLLKETDLSREEIYPLVQEAAFSQEKKSFREKLHSLLKSKGIETSLPETKDLRKVFCKEVEALFQEV